ncbi:MAG: transglycosylase SLT domain-containing protein [Proteobacteria bacterium]|nr:transglycosylase SLT domain-containing protein [Pseudomonadota bacterium]
MINKSFFLYFPILFLGFILFSPGDFDGPTSELQLSTIRLDETGHLAAKDIKAAETYLPYISKYVENDDEFIPLVLAVMKAESNFKIQAKSHKGALGLMQLMPTTALDEYRKSGMDVSLYKLKKNLIEQPELNIALGVGYLKTLQDRLEGIENPDKHRQLIIASYNAGIHRVKRAFKCKGFNCYKYKANRYSNNFFQRTIKTLPAETRNYLKNVERYYEDYKKAFSEQKPTGDVTI